MPRTAASYVEDVDPSPVEQARASLGLAAEAGHTDDMVALANLLAYRLDPPDLDGARHWYEQAARAGDTDAAVNLGVLLGYQVDPPELDGARRWYERAASAGNTSAMVNLGALLADRMEPPDLAGARQWYEEAARAGHPDGWYGLGAVAGRLGDRDEVEHAWRWLLETVDVDARTAASAALGLAALAAFDGLPSMAVPLLQVAAMCGCALAGPCASSLTANQANRRVALSQLAEQTAEPPALNFLGVAAYQAGATSEAISHWRRSDADGDPVATLLLHLTSDR